MKRVRLYIIGAGNRGTTFAHYALEHPTLARITGVAEPRTHYRQHLAHQHAIPETHVASAWTDLLQVPREADAVVIATPDRFHAGIAVAFAEAGYAILLEKPMATTLADCARIVASIQKHRVIFGVCHVYRYVAYTQRVKAIINAGTLGRIVNIQHYEPVGYWHQAHSFVRGNWHSEKESAFMLMTKSCHDIDWLQYLMGVPCEAVSSFGSLLHFRPEARPEGATDRCLDCAVESRCPYSAKKIYLDAVAQGADGWPYDVLTPDVTVSGITKALREGPYGRCVYVCDNDVVDHQVVNLRYAGGATASFTMTAFNRAGGRKSRIHGTLGDLYVDVKRDDTLIRHFDFLTDETHIEHVTDHVDTVLAGHHCGDYRTMERFIQAVATQNQNLLLTGPEETLASHRTVFAAEQARVEDRVVFLTDT